MFLLGAFVMVMGAVALVKTDGGGFSWVARGCGISLIAGGVQMCFQARRGLTVTDEGVDVQNTWRRRNLRWDGVRQFDLVWRYAYNSRWLKIELLDGSELWSPGFYARTKGQSKIVDEWVAELSARANAATGLGVAGG